MGSSTLDLIYGRSPQRITQILTTLAVALGPLATGLGKGYSSPALLSMQDEATMNNTMGAIPFVITQEEGSWVASLSLLGAFFGGIPGGLAMRFGRKNIMKVVSLPFSLCWMLTAFASNVYMVYASAFLCGICSAVISLVTPIYISEIAHPDIRGCLCSMAKLAAHLGMLLSFIIGGYVNWRQLAFIASAAPLALFCVAFAIPETPSFLLYRGDEKEAIKNYAWLNSGEDVTAEMQTLKENIVDIKQDEVTTCYKELRRDLIKPILITCGLMVFQKFSGANAFQFYAVPILSEAFVGIDPYGAAVVVSLLQIIAGMISSLLIDTAGRRPLLIISNFFMSAALAGFGTFVYVIGFTNALSTYDWIPLICALIFQISFSIGISPISWIYIGELFPLKHRGLGAIANSVSYACSFISVKTFVDFQQALGLYGAFWLYSGISVIGLVFTIIIVPETKGEKIQEMRKKYEFQEKYTPIREKDIDNKLIP